MTTSWIRVLKNDSMRFQVIWKPVWSAAHSWYHQIAQEFLSSSFCQIFQGLLVWLESFLLQCCFLSHNLTASSLAGADFPRYLLRKRPLLCPTGRSYGESKRRVALRDQQSVSVERDGSYGQQVTVPVVPIITQSYPEDKYLHYQGFCRACLANILATRPSL